MAVLFSHTFQERFIGKNLRVLLDALCQVLRCYLLDVKNRQYFTFDDLLNIMRFYFPVSGLAHLEDIGLIFETLVHGSSVSPDTCMEVVLDTHVSSTSE